MNTTEYLLVGVWAPVAGNPQDTIEFRADGMVRMAFCEGSLHLEGRYHLLDENVVEMSWNVATEAEAMVDRLNQGLARQAGGRQVRVVRKTVWLIDVTDSELRTLHMEKGRGGHFRRVGQER